MLKNLYQSFSLAFLLFVFFGALYPFLTTIVGHTLFKNAADGSLVYINHKAVGSKLIAQNFTKPEYFHGRPSSAGQGNDPLHSGASSFAATNPALYTKINENITKVLKDNPTIKVSDIPIDLVTSSGSGLDPDISLESAYIQIARIAKFRNIPEEKIKQLIKEKGENPILGFLGQKKVNVLALNIALNSMTTKE